MAWELFVFVEGAIHRLILKLNNMLHYIYSSCIFHVYSIISNENEMKSEPNAEAF